MQIILLHACGIDLNFSDTKNAQMVLVHYIRWHNTYKSIKNCNIIDLNSKQAPHDQSPLDILMYVFKLNVILNFTMLTVVPTNL